MTLSQPELEAAQNMASLLSGIRNAELAAKAYRRAVDGMIVRLLLADWPSEEHGIDRPRQLPRAHERCVTVTPSRRALHKRCDARQDERVAQIKQPDEPRRHWPLRSAAAGRRSAQALELQQQYTGIEAAIRCPMWSGDWYDRARQLDVLRTMLGRAQIELRDAVADEQQA